MESAASILGLDSNPQSKGHWARSSFPSGFSSPWNCIGYINKMSLLLWISLSSVPWEEYLAHGAYRAYLSLLKRINCNCPDKSSRQEVSAFSVCLNSFPLSSTPILPSCAILKVAIYTKKHWCVLECFLRTLLGRTSGQADIGGSGYIPALEEEGRETLSPLGARKTLISPTWKNGYNLYSSQLQDRNNLYRRTNENSPPIDTGESKWPTHPTQEIGWILLVIKYLVLKSMRDDCQHIQQGWQLRFCMDFHSHTLSEHILSVIENFGCQGISHTLGVLTFIELTFWCEKTRTYKETIKKWERKDEVT